MTDALLVLNAGSSSLKFALYDNPGLALLLKGAVSRLNQEPRLKIRAQDRADCDRVLGPGPMPVQEAARAVFEEIAQRGLLARIGAVGHRVVHGGRAFIAATILHAETRTALRRLVPLAPLHQPYNLDIVDLAAGLMPAATQVACFDTAFHARRPLLDRLYGLPLDYAEDGVVAYGFHGLSYAHVAAMLRRRDGARAGGRCIVAHLGSGASLCAMRAGESVATTMGFSALDGLIMGTRCGALDPGVILHLLSDRRMSVQAVSELLYEQSGLRGLSGLTGDMQTLLESDDPRAQQAVDLFVYRIARAIGSLAASLGGLDTLVFTAGIGENAPAIRARIGAACGWLGASIDEKRNARGETEIMASGAAVDVLIVPADEERTVAEETLACLGADLQGNDVT